VSFGISAGGTISFQQHSYRLMGLVSYPDGSTKHLDSETSDPARFKASGELRAEAYAGVDIEASVLGSIGIGMELNGGLAAAASVNWPPQVCLSGYPFLRGTLYADLNTWVKDWKHQLFSVELDFAKWDSCEGTGWHVAWQSTTNYPLSVACPTTAVCFVAGRTPKYGYVLRTVNGGQTWTSTVLTAHTVLNQIACSDASHCVAAGDSDKVAVTSNGGASWSEVRPPFYVAAISGIGSVTCVPGGTCYLMAGMNKYSGELVYGSTDYGRTWTGRTLLSDEPDAMDCLSASACVADGEVPGTGALLFPAASETTRDGWTSWSAGKFPKNWDGLISVSCQSMSLCFAGGSDMNNEPGKVLRSTNFGATWQAVPDGKIGQLSPWAVSCVPGAMCVVSGEQAVAKTVDGGRTWTSTTISKFPAADGTFTIDLACPSLGHCVAIEIGGPSAIVVS
jgi:photosystem II stability/assembly factor-like uncharacterized protein